MPGNRRPGLVMQIPACAASFPFQNESTASSAETAEISLYRSVFFMIVDFHTHIFPDKIAARTIQKLESIGSAPFLKCRFHSYFREAA